MSITRILYDLIIYPLRIIFEYIYDIAYETIGNYGLAIVFLSLAVSLLILPLYRRADALQKEEQEREDAMKEWVDKIKAAFTGDERFMMLSAYYREMHYSPLYQLNSAISTLLQIPFLMAAYSFLSNYQPIRGIPFGPIADLGAPDGLLTLGTLSVNVLPILMTVINLVSGIIYTKGQAVRNRIQVIGIALVFLVVLYQAPSALALYWTLNNCFSLVKNIFYRLNDPRKVLSWLLAGIGAACLVLVVVIQGDHLYRRVILLVLGLVLMLPLGRRYFPAVRKVRQPEVLKKSVKNADTGLFWAGAAFLALLCGLLIPSGVIASSPQEFVIAQDPHNPLHMIVSSALIAAGLFVIWFGVFYYLANRRARGIFTCALWTGCVIAAMDYMFFGTALGSLTTLFEVEFFNGFTGTQKLVSFIAVVLALLAAVIVFRFRKIVKGIYLAGFCGVAVLLVMNIHTINRGYERALDDIESTGSAQEEPVITLTASGKNVMVIILDRAVSMFVPYMLEERPDLRQMLDGFTFYPNTLSYGGHTNIGMPPVWGGYEYTPDRMQERTDLTLQEKNDEALKVLPKLFNDNGMKATVFDAPYAGYQVLPDLSIYNDLPDTDAYISEGFFSYQYPEYRERVAAVQERNLFCYSLFKTAPSFIGTIFYDGGQYHSGLVKPQKFLDSYTVLTHMQDMTKVTQEDGDQFFIMENHTTHDLSYLQLPDYTWSETVDNSGFDNVRSDGQGHEINMDMAGGARQYHSGMASLLRLGEYFDYLRQEGLYDNTRIFIVSDHGSRHLFLFDEEAYYEDMDLNVENYNPLLMVKDFGDTGFRISEAFMTNADVPALAMEGMIDNPVNPYTGNPINNDAKEGDQLVFQTHNWRIQTNHGVIFDEEDCTWFRLKNQYLFDRNNWEIVKSNATSRRNEEFHW